MSITFRQASAQDANTIATMVVDLTKEICLLTDMQHFDIDLESTKERCSTLIDEGHYAGIIAETEGKVIAIVTITETYALYAGGKIGAIQEFYVEPKFRASGVGSLLIEQVQQYGKQQAWSCIELCTPPLPAFERTLNFYQKNGLVPVGGRKMRQSLA